MKAKPFWFWNVDHGQDHVDRPSGSQWLGQPGHRGSREGLPVGESCRRHRQQTHVPGGGGWGGVFCITVGDGVWSSTAWAALEPGLGLALHWAKPSRDSVSFHGHRKGVNFRILESNLSHRGWERRLWSPDPGVSHRGGVGHEGGRAEESSRT